MISSDNTSLLSAGLIRSKDPETRAAFDAAWDLADGEGPILLLGEPGSGRGLVAQQLHDRGRHRGGTFINASCSSLDSLRLLENGAPGTVFLREISNLDMDLQLELAAILEAGDLRPRVIAGGPRDLEKRCADGAFAEPLFAILSASCLRLPALRERPADIPDLVAAFLAHRGHKDGGTVRFAEAVMGYLVDYDWPGNVAELEQVVVRLCEHTRGDVVSADELPPQIRWFPSERCDRAARSKVERGFNPLSEEFQFQLIADAMRRTHGR